MFFQRIGPFELGTALGATERSAIAVPFHVSLQFNFAAKGRRALSTLVNFLTFLSSVHHLDVLLQHRNSLKPLWAQIAFKGFLIRVIFHMLISQPQRSKGFQADSALKRLQNSVGHDVHFESLRAFKTSCALMTLKWSVVTVHLHVTAEICFVRKFLGAHLTHVRLLASVDQLVRFQSVRSFEVCRALVTLKGSEVAVHKHVFLQGGFHCKCLAAPVTDVWSLTNVGWVVASAGAEMCFSRDCTCFKAERGLLFYLQGIRHGRVWATTHEHMLTLIPCTVVVIRYSASHFNLLGIQAMGLSVSFQFIASLELCRTMVTLERSVAYVRSLVTF